MKKELENIDDDFLNNLKNEGGFKTPANYFDISKASNLSKINAKTNFSVNNNEGGFSVPNNYFETNKAAILKTINNKKTRLIPLANWQLISGIAALFIAIISIFIFVANKSTSQLNANLNNISEAEMIEYLANNDVKIEWINELNAGSKTTLKKEENNKEIEQYLLDHADEQTLLDEL